MWRSVEYDNKPEQVDETSSKVYVYVRKDIEPEENEDGFTAWKCEEKKIKKEDWELYQTLMTHGVELVDIQDALIELASIISEV